MRKLFLLAGAATMVAAAPALAKPGGGHGYGHGASMKTAKTVHVAKAKPVKAKAVKVKATRRDRDGDGILDSDEALARKYGGALCPPGLWKKTPSCIPPGQNQRLFRTGQMVPTRYKYITPFGDIPSALVTQYDLSSSNRYIYRNNVIYVIDPVTNRVVRVINGVL